MANDQWLMSNDAFSCFLLLASSFAIQLRLQLLHLFHQADEFFTEVGELIFDPGRNFGKLNPFEQAASRELLEPIRQDLGADALDMSFESARSPDAVGHRAEHADGPAASD